MGGQRWVDKEGWGFLEQRVSLKSQKPRLWRLNLTRPGGWAINGLHFVYE